MGFIQIGLGGKPLKQQGKRKLEFSEFGIVWRSEPENQNKNMALDIVKNLSNSITRQRVDHEALVRNFGTVTQPDSKEPEIKKSFRGKHELDHEALTRNFGR